MQLKLIYPQWGSAHLKWSHFLKKVKDVGYDGIEIPLPLVKKEKEQIISMVGDYGLEIVAQHWQTKAGDFKTHKTQYLEQLINLAESTPLLVNSHTGMDFFNYDQNAELIQLGLDVEQEYGIPITHETHRSRFSYAAHACKSYLKDFPNLKLTADFAHWTCVAETLLENQTEAVALAIEHTYHIHARVGSAQSPQVIDPTDERYADELAQFKKWWRAMIKNAKQKGRDYITIAPEHGPYPYATHLPHSDVLLADQWNTNQFIRQEIENDCQDLCESSTNTLGD